MFFYRKKRGETRKKIALAILIFILSICFVSSQDIIEKVQPSISFTFDEEVNLDGAWLFYFGEDYEYWPDAENISTTNTTTDKKTYTITPVNALSNGGYILVINVSDILGNWILYEKDFIIEAPETKITIISPRLGVSKEENFDVTIRTTRGGLPEATECRHSASPFTLYKDMAPFDQSSPDRTEHTVFNKSGTPNSATHDEINIECVDTQDRHSRERFELYVDTIKPKINSLVFDPETIREYPLQSTLEIKTDEATLCKYSTENLSYGQMTEVEGFDELDTDAYKKTTEEIVTLPEDTNITTQITFYVECEDIAGWRTNRKTKTLGVDLTTPITITVDTPKRYTTNTTITLQVRTNKNGYCVYRNKTADPLETNPMSSGKIPSQWKTIHTADLGEHEEGTYEIIITCTSVAAGVAQSGETTHTYTIDTTPPTSKPSINGSTITCRNDSFIFAEPLKFSAEDPESGIKTYKYKINVAGNSSPLVNWTEVKKSVEKITKDIDGETLSLKTTETYIFTVVAINGAGLESPEAQYSVKYDPTDTDCLEKNQPYVMVIENKTDQGTIITLMCDDDSGCDNQSFYYGLAENEPDCEPTIRLYGPPFTLTQRIYTNQYLCYNVSDIVGNYETGSKLIIVEITTPGHCNNGVKDEDETDIDCGGSCLPCGIGQECIDDNDCAYGSCIQGVCTEATCSDNIKNQGETDIDCGGPCSPCEINQSCIVDEDCLSLYCDFNTYTCQMPSCNDSIKNGDETDIDCGGSCPEKCPLNQKCLSDFDCEEGVCIGNICSGEIGVDTDFDGIPDDWEEDNNLDPNDPGDADLDNDNDGLTNLEEYQKGTDPNNSDSDGDGIEDGADLNPLIFDYEAPSFAATFFKLYLFLILAILCMVSGLIYLAYERYVLRAISGRALTPAELRRGIPTRELMARLTEEKKKAEERKKAMVEEERKRKLVQEKIARERKEKEEKRKKIFGTFEVAKKEKPEIEGRAIEEPKEKAKEEIGKPKEKAGWFSLEALKRKITPKKEVKPEEKKETEIERLTRMLAEEKEKKMKKVPRKKPPEAKRLVEEDLFKKLEAISKKRVIDESAFEFLAKKKGPKPPEKLAKKLEKEKPLKKPMKTEKIKKPRKDVLKELEKIAKKSGKKRTFEDLKKIAKKKIKK